MNEIVLFKDKQNKTHPRFNKVLLLFEFLKFYLGENLKSGKTNLIENNFFETTTTSMFLK